MSFETGTATSINDLMTKLSTFAVTDGWTQDQYTAEAGSTDGKLSIHKGGVYVSFAWNGSQASNIAVYQALGFTGAGTNTWEQQDDSGCGIASTPSTGNSWNTTTTNRFVNTVGAGPFTSYHFFSGSGSEDYIHIALEYTPFIYRHFGFGELEKAWDWTGGEYCYGHTQYAGSPTTQQALLSSNGSGSTTKADRAGTLHVEGLPAQPGSSKWAAFASFSTHTSPFNDRAGNTKMRVDGGCPGGPIGQNFNNLPSGAGDGFLPMTANAIHYINIVASPDNGYFLGWQPDVLSFNIKNFAPKAEITIGGDTWVVFPHVRKQNTGDINESENLGIAYKKIV